MATPLELKRNLEANLKSSYLNSGGMKVMKCVVNIDTSGLIKVSMVINPGSLPTEGVEELINKTFDTVGVKAFTKDGWNDININHESSSVVKVDAEGYM
jgi:hypothetical protein